LPIQCIQPFELTDLGQFTKVTGLSFAAGKLPIKVAQLMADNAQRVIKSKYKDVPVNINVVKESEVMANGTGTAIILVTETSTGLLIAGTGLGSRDTRAEDVGRKAGEELLHNMQHGGCVDDHLQDQLIIFMALAKGQSRLHCGAVTLHTETAIHVAQLMTKAKFTIEKKSDGTTIIICDGIGQLNTAV